MELIDRGGMGGWRVGGQKAGEGEMRRVVPDAEGGNRGNCVEG